MSILCCWHLWKKLDQIIRIEVALPRSGFRRRRAQVSFYYITKTSPYTQKDQRILTRPAILSLVSRSTSARVSANFIHALSSIPARIHFRTVIYVCNKPVCFQTLEKFWGIIHRMSVPKATWCLQLLCIDVIGKVCQITRTTFVLSKSTKMEIFAVLFY